MPQYFHIRCTIERGGFASERSFTIKLPNGQTLVGTADVRYLCNEKKQALKEGEPPFNEKIDGYVKCRVVREVNETRIIEVPSADVVSVPAGDLVEMNC